MTRRANQPNTILGRVAFKIIFSPVCNHCQIPRPKKSTETIKAIQASKAKKKRAFSVPWEISPPLKASAWSVESGPKRQQPRKANRVDKVELVIIKGHEEGLA